MRVDSYLRGHGLEERVHKAIEKLPMADMKRENIKFILSNYSLVFNHKALSRFGCFIPGKSRIELTAAYLVAPEASDYPLDDGVKPEAQEDHNQTLLHEVAHLITWFMYPKRVRPHGAEWRFAMRALGLRPERCGYSPVLAQARAKRYNHLYTCMECGYEHKTIRKLKGERSHGRCGRLRGRMAYTRIIRTGE